MNPLKRKKKLVRERVSEPENGVAWGCSSVRFECIKIDEFARPAFLRHSPSCTLMRFSCQESSGVFARDRSAATKSSTYPDHVDGVSEGVKHSGATGPTHPTPSAGRCGSGEPRAITVRVSSCARNTRRAVSLRDTGAASVALDGTPATHEDQTLHQGICPAAHPARVASFVGVCVMPGRRVKPATIAARSLNHVC